MSTDNNQRLSGLNLRKVYGNREVVKGISIKVNQGEVVGLLGPNGAGKTSMFNLITGTLKPDSGQIFFAGDDITHSNAAKRSRSGIARSFQVPQPFSGLSVFENAMVAATQSAGLYGKKAEQHCLSILNQTELLPKANILAGSLTLLELKRLELTRALCTRPKLLLLDEIAGGLKAWLL